jgi:hypothetical protein
MVVFRRGTSLGAGSRQDWNIVRMSAKSIVENKLLDCDKHVGHKDS